MNKFISSAFAAILAFALIGRANAETCTCTIDGLTYTYHVINGTARIGAWSSDEPAIDKTTSGALTIPASLDGYPVTIIWDGAFYECTNLTSVSIPDGVTGIGYAYNSKGAFQKCSGLVSVILPDSLECIGRYAFQECISLKSVVIPYGAIEICDSSFKRCESLENIEIPNSVTKLGSYAFSGCSSLSSVTIPGSVTSIGGEVLAWCRNLDSLTLSDGLASIGYSAFQYCAKLKEVTIPASVRSIGYKAFAYCSGLVSVTISENIENIRTSTFEGCRKLETVTVPYSVTNVESCAFRNCTSLTNVVFDGVPPTCAKDAFENVTSIGLYHAQYATEWKTVLDADGKWNGLAMKPLEVTVFPTATTDAEVAAALADAKDARLAANVTTVAKYEKYQAWVDKAAGASDLAARQKVRDSSLAWFAYALDLPTLPETTPTSLSIDSMAANDDGAWNLSVSVGDLSAGSDADTNDLKTVFSVEGATDLTEASFSPDNVKTTFIAPQDGKVKVSVAPKNDAGRFFIRMKMTP